MTHPAEGRIAEIIGAVARQALADFGRTRIALLDDGGREAALAAWLLARTLGKDAVVCVTGDQYGVEPFLPDGDRVPDWRIDEEVRRLRARLMDGVLVAHPASKTALLLRGELPPEPLLPLGDLWATDALALAGGGPLPPDVAEIAGAAGGIEALDAALRGWTDGRDASALDRLPAEAADRVRARLAAGRASRRNPRIVPKLGGRTLCMDLME